MGDGLCASAEDATLPSITSRALYSSDGILQWRRLKDGNQAMEQFSGRLSLSPPGQLGITDSASSAPSPSSPCPPSTWPLLPQYSILSLPCRHAAQCRAWAWGGSAGNPTPTRLLNCPQGGSQAQGAHRSSIPAKLPLDPRQACRVMCSRILRPLELCKARLRGMMGSLGWLIC